MKNHFLLLTILLLLVKSPLRAQKPVYFNIVSHNEITDSLDYAHSMADFKYIRGQVKELCDSIISKQAKYNMQVDANFIFGALRYDNAAANPIDILEWASNSPYIEVDGHNHFDMHVNPYNYSDLAYLLDSCGVEPEHHILGGITYATMSVGGLNLVENWTQYQTPKEGYTFKNFTWQADIIWGTATPGHVADYTTFGVWKPAGGSSPAEFGTHDPDQPLTCIGGGCKNDVGYNIDPQNNKLFRSTDKVISNILSIVDSIQLSADSPNDFYTMNMLINFRDIPRIPSFADSISKIIDGLQAYVDEGKIVWATLGEKYDLWYSMHSDPADYFNVDCSAIPVGVSPLTEAEEGSFYPNPTDGLILIPSDFPDNGPFDVRIYDLSGKLVWESRSGERKLYIGQLPPGIYFMKLHLGDTLYYHKIILENRF